MEIGMRKIISLITVVGLSFITFNLEPAQIYTIARRIKGINPASDKILEKILSLSQSKDDQIKISAASALVKLGKQAKGYQILMDFSLVLDPAIRLSVARAYFDLEDIDPLNRIKGLRALESIIISTVSEIDLLLEIAREYFRQGLVAKAEYVLDYLEATFSSFPQEVNKLRIDIGRRRLVKALIEHTKEKGPSGENLGPVERIRAARELLNKMSNCDWEEKRMIKEAIQELSGSGLLNIKIGLAEILGENIHIMAWPYSILTDLMTQRVFPWLRQPWKPREL
jgi:hypothetical protein